MAASVPTVAGATSVRLGQENLLTWVEGLAELRALSLGDPRIVIAILDGPVDFAHPVLARSRLEQLEPPLGVGPAGPALRHGTMVASLIFGRSAPGLAVEGVAPDCRGLIIPLFEDGPDEPAGELPRPHTSQFELARAIARAVDAGASIINVSAGEPAVSGDCHPVLRRAVARARRKGVLIVAALGNERHEERQMPAAMPGVVAVGAWPTGGERGAHAQPSEQGPGALPSVGKATCIVAPGHGLLAALPGGGVGHASGTSYATAIVSGVAGLLASFALKRQVRLSSEQIREILLDSAQVRLDDSDSLRFCQAGRLNLKRAMVLMTRRGLAMSDEVMSPRAGTENIVDASNLIPGDGARVHDPAPGVIGVGPAGDGGCGCTSCKAKEAARSCGCASCRGLASAEGHGKLVFAIGQLGYDLMSEARRDSIQQAMIVPGQPAKSPYDPADFLEYLRVNPWEASSVVWTLNFDLTPLYAVVPSGPFAARAFELLREFLAEQAQGKVEQVSIPGRIVGRARLQSGQVVPAVAPEPRGMFSWTTEALVAAVAGSPPATGAPVNVVEAYAQRTGLVRGFLQKVYHELRNLGATAEERAVNFAATNAFQLGQISAELAREVMELDSIEVERSPICRPESDCWDVKILFFYPNRPHPAPRKVYRFTVDVSDVVPVLVGPMRAWSVR